MIFSSVLHNSAYITNPNLNRKCCYLYCCIYFCKTVQQWRKSVCDFSWIRIVGSGSWNVVMKSFKIKINRKITFFCLNYVEKKCVFFLLKYSFYYRTEQLFISVSYLFIISNFQKLSRIRIHWIDKITWIRSGSATLIKRTVVYRYTFTPP